jgi:hypothetical protein
MQYNAIKHCFYFPGYDVYYVCSDGNRRTSVGQVLGVQELRYDITELILTS